MQLEELLTTLGYADSPNLLRAGHATLESAPGFGHVFRLGISQRGLKGVYTLRPPATASNEPLVPIVYLCEANSESEADQTHRLVWNQDVVPFVLVQTPTCLKLYSGFRYRKRDNQPAEGLLQTLRTTAEIIQLADSLGAEAIDEGRIWRSWGNEVQPEGRVDWRLLDNLQRLDHWLQRAGLEHDVSHALIGKYVYLHYLRDRGILSQRKLASWEIAEQEVFGREATLAGLSRTIERLDDWLNGGVFPIRLTGRRAPSQEQVRRVAATFMGDQPIGDGSWQLHLDFKAYDFSYIPIETISVVYEQFLHSPLTPSAVTQGRAAGAYYTPIPVVNFMLAEMEDRNPFKRGMRVLDPSCGSGAFLVQCYRRLIEREYPPNGPAPGPIRLRELLQQHIFGVDQDADACSVTELSLILTLLDYVNPPDLENDKRVKLPSLRNANIFCENFFTSNAQWHRLIARGKFDWILGNPPWNQLNPKRLTEKDKPVWKWMVKARSEGKPIGGNKVAQAFAWIAGECLSAGGEAALLLPAMTLFEDHSRPFRAAFLKAYQLRSVANFSNLAEVLFAGRSRVPAAAVFYHPRPEELELPENEFITTYAPLVANQEPTRPTIENTRQQTWAIVLNASEVRDIPLASVISGSGLPWKLATWGSEFDARFLRRLNKHFPRLGALEADKVLVVSEGLQLRRGHDHSENVERVAEVIKKLKLDVRALEDMRDFFVFPTAALAPVSKELAFARKGRVKLPLSICRPPHLIVSAARNFAIYSDEFIVVPPRQIGITSPVDDKSFLIALSLFLSSDFAFYHQFLTSTQFGVQRGRATLNALREMPVPVNALTGPNATPWQKLHQELVDSTHAQFSDEGDTLFSNSTHSQDAHAALLRKLNELVSEALDLNDIERALVHDLVSIKLELNDGKLGRRAVEPPTLADMERYVSQLKSQLDGFTEGEVTKAHNIQVLIERESALVVVDLTQPINAGIHIYQADQAEAAELAGLRQALRREQSQWVYFNRNCRVFQENRILMLKPLQRFQWTVSQAVTDANDLIAEAVSVQESEA